LSIFDSSFNLIHWHCAAFLNRATLTLAPEHETLKPLENAHQPTAHDFLEDLFKFEFWLGAGGGEN
jgi:hypothetical protein